MNANDLYDWKRHPVTQVVFSELDGRIKAMMEALVESGGVNILLDAEYRGAIKAHRDVLNIDWTELQETE